MLLRQSLLLRSVLQGRDFQGRRSTRMLNTIKLLLAIFAITLVTGHSHAHPLNRHSAAECYLHGHRMYVPDGLDYPRQAWGGWGISCRALKPEGIEGAETSVSGSGERPIEWCGWWMRQHLGGHFGPEYNVARNWLNVGRPLPGPRPGALGVKEHHVFQVVQVISSDQVLAISGNDHNAVRTRVRSTAGVIGWRDVTDIAVTIDSASPKEPNVGGGLAATGQAHTVDAMLDGLAW